MLQKIQRFGGAMMTPVLLFAFNGILLALATAFLNEQIVGSIASEGTFWTNIWTVVESGAWVVFDHMELLFLLGLPIGLANKSAGRASLAAFIIYMTWNTFINAILQTWDFGIDVTNVEEAIGLKEIGGIATLDTNIIGAILVSAIVVYIHNHYFDVSLPEWLGIFSGTSFVVIIGFIVALPLAFLTVLVWPPVQNVIFQLQDVLAQAGTVGVGIYVFLERILIPTGLHHFVYQPFIFGPAVVEGGLEPFWLANLGEIANASGTLREIFPEGGFALHNVSKMFAPLGIGAAFIATSKSSKRKQTMALVIPTVATAVFAGITEPFEFTFLFLAPQLFLVHSILAGFLGGTLYALGVSGDVGSGLLAAIPKFVIPMFNNHLGAIVAVFGVGLLFSVGYFFIFRFAIVRWDIKTPGREENDEEEAKMYSKEDYKQKKGHQGESNPKDESKASRKARHFLDGLGGATNISEINNCATRLRISVNNENNVKGDKFFRSGGASGVVQNGRAIQVIVGLDVPQVREEFESIVNQYNEGE